MSYYIAAKMNVGDKLQNMENGTIFKVIEVDNVKRFEVETLRKGKFYCEVILGSKKLVKYK